VKVLFISGYSEEVVLNQGVIPTDCFLQKPFSPNQIARKVREVLDQPK
jgi:two-component system cell cycle sensor histidine kinase/response regulator CckA